MTRLIAILILLFVGFDAAVCPIVCLAADAASHKTSNVPSHAAGANAPCGGACSAGTVPFVGTSSVTLTQASDRLSDIASAIPALARTADIDHPPRLA